MAEPLRLETRFPHAAFVSAALQEWADMIRLVYAPKDPKAARAGVSETYEPSSTHRMAKTTHEQANPILSALIADERAGRRLARTVHDYLMREGRQAAMLLWLEQEGHTHEEIGKQMVMRKALVGPALRLAKISLGIYLMVVMRHRMRS